MSDETFLHHAPAHGEHRRPWSATGLTGGDWLDLEPEWVDLREVYFCQGTVSVSGLIEAALGRTPVGGDSLPHLVEYQGRLWVEDGTHRTLVFLLTGRPRQQVRVYRWRKNA